MCGEGRKRKRGGGGLLRRPDGGAILHAGGRRGGGVPGLKTFKTQASEGGLYEYQYYGDNSDSASSLYRTWSVPYKAGTITAKAYTDESRQTEITDTEGRREVSTTGEEAKLTAKVYGDRIPSRRTGRIWPTSRWM